MIDRAIKRFLRVCALCGIFSTGALLAEPLQVKDPHYGELLYHFYQQNYFTAIVHTMVELQVQDGYVASIPGRLPAHRADAELLLGGLQLAYGQYRYAAAVFEKILASNPEPALRNRVWYFVAKSAYERGRYEEAEAALTRVDAEVAADLKAEIDLLLAQVWILRGRYAEAAALLAAWQGPENLRGYAAYNRGVALLYASEFAAGIEVLNQLGSLETFDNESDALKDKANLALGYYLLRSQQATAARDLLERVRLQGPFSNRALLGLGWAQAELQDYPQALVAWEELRARESADFAILEAQLAVPYAHSQLALHGRAVQGYEAAIDAYHAEAQRIDTALLAAESGELIADLLAQTRINDPHDAGQSQQPVTPNEATGYFVSLLSGHDFRRALRHYRELQDLAVNLHFWQQSAGAFDDMLATRRERYQRVLPRIAEVYQRLDFERLYAERDRLQNDLQILLDSEDQLAAAHSDEQQRFAYLDDIERRLEIMPPSPETDEAWNKLRLLKGLAIWQLNENYPERQWTLSKGMRDIERGFVQTENLLRRVESARVQVPNSFSGFEQRSVVLKQRIAELQNKTAQIIALQDLYLRQLAMAQLQAYRQRLDTYLLQARYGLAQNYDLLAAQDPTTPAVEIPAEKVPDSEVNTPTEVQP